MNISRTVNRRKLHASMSVQPTVEHYTYKQKEIEYTIWHTLRSSDVLTILFLGVAQIEKLPKWVAEHCPNDVIVVQGAPLWNAAEDGADTVEFMFAYIKNVFEYICQTQDFESINIITESQAAPGTAWLFSQEKYNRRVKRITLVQPLGFTQKEYGTSVDDATKVLARRARHNMGYQLKAFLFEPKQRYNHHIVSKHLNFKQAASKAQFGSGLLHDATADFRQLARVYPDIVIVCGENDKLFPPSELSQSLQRHRIPMRLKIVPRVSHATFVSRDGLRLLQEALGTTDKIHLHKPRKD